MVWTMVSDRQGADLRRLAALLLCCMLSGLATGAARAQATAATPGGGPSEGAGASAADGRDNDPLGDLLAETSEFDLRALHAVARDDSLVLHLRFAEPLTGVSGLYGFVDLDLDRDATTGSQPAVSLVASAAPELGSEAYVDLDTLDLEAGTVAVVTEETASGAPRETAVPAILAGDEVTIRLPPSLVPDPRGVHVAAAVGTEAEPSDVAPNSGVVSSRAAAAAGEIALRDGRFTVSVAWTKQTGERGIGRPVLSSEDSTLLWFFDPDNWEMVVKVLDGCGINDHYWVFTAASTTVQVTVTVTDLLSGLARVYRTPGGGPAAPTADTEAFASCP